MLTIFIFIIFAFVFQILHQRFYFAPQITFFKNVPASLIFWVATFSFLLLITKQLKNKKHMFSL